MDVEKLADIYYKNDSKNTSDNEHIVFKLYEGEFSHGTFVEESHTLWKINKDAIIAFTICNGDAYNTSVMYKDNKLIYYNFDNFDNFVNYKMDPSAKIRFFKKLKQCVFDCDIKVISIIFKSCMSKTEVRPYMEVFLSLIKIYEHQQAKYMPKHIAKLRTKLTEKAITNFESL